MSLRTRRRLTFRCPLMTTDVYRIEHDCKVDECYSQSSALNNESDNCLPRNADHDGLRLNRTEQDDKSEIKFGKSPLCLVRRRKLAFPFLVFPCQCVSDWCSTLPVLPFDSPSNS